MHTSNAQNALNFPDANDYGTVAQDPFFELPSVFTIESWVKLNGSGYQTVAATDSLNGQGHRGYWFGSTPNGVAGFQIFDGSFSWTTFTGTTNINDNQWHHVAVTSDLTDVKIIVDGVEESSGTYYAPAGAVNGFRLDVGIDQEGNSLTGSIDDLRIWWRHISTAEIDLYKDSCLTGQEDSLIALYKFDETMGTTFSDAGIYNLDGQLWNTTDSDWVSGVVCQSTASISETDILEGAIVYPNPTEGKVQVDVVSPDPFDILVYGIDGQLVYSYYGAQFTHDFEIDSKSGVYQVQLISKLGATKHLKLVKL